MDRDRLAINRQFNLVEWPLRWRICLQFEMLAEIEKGQSRELAGSFDQRKRCSAVVFLRNGCGRQKVDQE